MMRMMLAAAAVAWLIGRGVNEVEAREPIGGKLRHVMPEVIGIARELRQGLANSRHVGAGGVVRGKGFDERTQRRIEFS